MTGLDLPPSRLSRKGRSNIIMSESRLPRKGHSNIITSELQILQRARICMCLFVPCNLASLSDQGETCTSVCGVFLLCPFCLNQPGSLWRGEHCWGFLLFISFMPHRPPAVINPLPRLGLGNVGRRERWGKKWLAGQREESERLSAFLSTSM